MSITLDERKQVVRGWVRENFVRPNVVANQHIGNISAAVTAIDNLIQSQQALFNNALPEPFKSTATTKQKTSLFSQVMLARVK